MLYNNFQGRKAAKNATNAEAAIDARPAPEATPEPSQAAAMGASSPNLFSMMGLPDPTKAKKKIPLGLEYLEEGRTAGLSQVPSANKLRNLWQPSSTFDVFVCLSTSPQRVTDFSAIEGVTAQWKAGEDSPALPGLTHSEGAATVIRHDGEGSSGGGSASFSLFGGLFKRQLDKVAGGGITTTLPNATYTGLLDNSDSDSNSNSEGDSNGCSLLWAQHGLSYDWSSGTVEQHVNVSLPTSVLGNQTGVYAHVYAVTSGSHPDVSHMAHAGAWSVAHTVYPLVTHLKKKPTKVTYSLLGGEESGSASASPEVEAAVTVPPQPGSNETRWLPYWRPSLSLRLLLDHSVHKAGALPPPLDSVLTVVRDDVTAGMPGGGWGYVPPLIVDEFWSLKSHWVELNATHPARGLAPLHVSYSPLAMWRWAMASQMESQWSMQEAMGAAGEGESDLLKGILMDTNPILLGVTALVSLLHMVFEFLAFRNDVSFWRGVKTTAGLSVRSIGMSFVTQLIVLLYLADNDTSWMVLLSSGVGLAIEAWKLRKAVTVGLSWHAVDWAPGGIQLPWLDVSDKEEHDEATTETRKYDNIATRHMLVCLVPLVMGQSIFSLVYETHKSWYSWLIGSLTR